MSFVEKKTTQKTTQKILTAIKESSSITREELAGLLGITPDGVKYHLDSLKKRVLLKELEEEKKGCGFDSFKDCN